MKSHAAFFFTAIGLGASALACSSILGLQEPTIDNNLGDGGTGTDSPTTDSPTTTDSGGDAGTTPVQLFNARVRHIALDDNNVYYTELFDFVVGKIGKDGTGQVALVNGSDMTGYFPDSIAVDDTDVFWASVGGISQCKKTGCANSPIHIIDENADASVTYSPGGVNVDATNVYFVQFDSNTTTSTIFKVPKGAANGTVSVLVPPNKLCPTINRMVLVGTYLYFTCDEGQVGRVTASSGAVEILSANGSPASADAFAVNGTSIYYGQFLEQASIFQMPLVADASSTPIALTQPYVNAVDLDGQYLYWATVGVSLDNGAGKLSRCSLSQCNATTKVLAGSIDIPIDVKVDTTSIFWSANGNGDTLNTGVWRMTKTP